PIGHAGAVGSRGVTGRTGGAPARGTLVRNLWRVGVWSGRSPGVGALRGVLALVGFACVALGSASALIAAATYEHRADIARARSPVLVDADADRAPLRWRILNAAVDSRAVGLYAIEPLT